MNVTVPTMSQDAFLTQLPVRGQVRERLLCPPERPGHDRGLGPCGASGPQDQRRHALLPDLPLPAEGGQDGQVRPRVLLALHPALPRPLRRHLAQVPHLLRAGLQGRPQERRRSHP